MPIRLKTLLTLIATAVLVLLALYIFTQLTIVNNLEKQEKHSLYENVKRTLKVIEKDLNSLSSTNGDWAYWDETNLFIKNKNLNYIEKNLSDDSLNTLNLDLMAFFDINGNLIYEKKLAPDIEEEKFQKVSIENYILDKSVILQSSDIMSTTVGIMQVGKRPLLISAKPITSGDKTDGINGTLLMGRFIGGDQIKELEDIAGADVSFILNDSSVRKENNIGSYSNLIRDSNIYFYKLDGNFVDGYAVIKDIFGKNSFVLRLSMERIIYNEGYKVFKILLLTYLVLVAIFIWFIMFISGRVYLTRLEKLSDFMNEIAISKDTSARIKIEGRDELSNLASETNAMLEEIDKANERLIENQERLSLVLEGTNDGFWDLDIVTNKVFLSPRAKNILKHTREAEFDNLIRFSRYVHKPDLYKIIKLYRKILRGDTDLYKLEVRLITNGSKPLWIQIKGKVVSKDSCGKPLRMSGIVSDITENKEYENKIKYLSYHDVLTGLYNRAFIEENYRKMDTQYPTSIIMGDVNGLKFTNDAFGHREGDNLLISITDILIKSCRPTDIIGRIGGDEFVVILPDTTEAEANEVCARIKNYCIESDYKIIKPSIALGTGTKENRETSIYEVVEIAEGRMYQNKLLEDRSSRHSIVASMERSLLETDFETREHAKRLQIMSEKIGKRLNLINSQLDELALLSALHDIGKIAIPREILTKSGGLTNDEWEIIKKHSEIGYRIALSSHELMSIANAILAHHEKWDGSGYPNGLKGKEIPLMSRIIAIVDAYDVITNSRPYKKAQSHDVAIGEIIRCSETHFDPELVEVFVEVFKSDKSDIFENAI